MKLWETSYMVSSKTIAIENFKINHEVVIDISSAIDTFSRDEFQRIATTYHSSLAIKSLVKKLNAIFDSPDSENNRAKLIISLPKILAKSYGFKETALSNKAKRLLKLHQLEIETCDTFATTFYKSLET